MEKGEGDATSLQFLLHRGELCYQCINQPQHSLWFLEHSLWFLELICDMWYVHIVFQGLYIEETLIKATSNMDNED